ncbi:hypothetical protein PAMA_016744 [Pampus argenteus]
MKEETSLYSGQFDPGDNISCALRGHEDYRSAAVYAPKLPSVSVSPSGEIVEGSSVTLTCSSDANPAAKYTWYKENVNSDLQPLSKEPQLVFFSSIQSSDSGQYYCTAENKLGKRTSENIFIDVKYAPKRPSVSVSPSGEIVEGSSVNLTCSSDANPAANYTWYKENEESPKASGQIFTITDVRPEHSGNYYCVSQNRRGRHNSTLYLTVVAGSIKGAAAGSITAIFLAVIFFSAFHLIRKGVLKRCSEPRPDSKVQLNVRPGYASESAEQEDGLHYASISFSKSLDEALYSNIRPAHLHSQTEEEYEEGVDYTAVKVKSASNSPGLRCQEAAENASALYSTVRKSLMSQNMTS